DARKCIVDIERAAEGGRWDEFRDACHALKGTAANMGAMQLSESASAGMRMPVDQLVRNWRNLDNALRQQLEQALAALREEGDLVQLEADARGGGRGDQRARWLPRPATFSGGPGRRSWARTRRSMVRSWRSLSCSAVSTQIRVMRISSSWLTGCAPSRTRCSARRAPAMRRFWRTSSCTARTPSPLGTRTSTTPIRCSSSLLYITPLSIISSASLGLTRCDSSE